MTEAGLNTVNLSTLNTWQQCILFFLIMMGSAIFVSSFVLHVRKNAFEKKFMSIAEERRHKRSRSTLSFQRRFSRSSARPVEFESVDLEKKERDVPPVSMPEDRGRDVQANRIDASQDFSESAIEDGPTSRDGITFSPETNFRNNGRDNEGGEPRMRRRLFSMQGVGAHPSAGLHRSTSLSRPSLPRLDRSESHSMSKDTTDHYFPSSGFIARNSQFYGLTDAERDKLGGVEYKALYYLSWIVPLYFFLWQLIGCIGLAAYVALNRPSTARTNGLNPWWVGAFNGVSAFNNSGMSLLDANMVAFQTSYYMMLTMGLMILAGNTCYPIFLRLIIYTLWRLTPESDAWRDNRNTLQFLLDHPRRCYTNLFPSQHTWWLAFAVLVLNGTDWAAFEILNIGNDALNSALSTNIRVIDGLFQALAVRSGGFYVVSIPSLRISLQVLYVIMMYISVYPVVITMRNSNVYEERSLGIYADQPNYSDKGPQDESVGSNKLWRSLAGLKRRWTDRADVPDGAPDQFIRQQLRAQLAHDLWWIVLAVFLIMIVEGSQFNDNPAVFSVFNVIFEVVSAYGTVGISVGVPWAAYSFCGAWHTLSKLILCAVMLRGRHRGLPVAIDMAVLLPNEKHNGAEEEDAMIRMERAISRGRDEDAVV
ncbi:hypothetical protein MBLNU459_g3696t3 [Dothideomycetes sp. NU459]